MPLTVFLDPGHYRHDPGGIEPDRPVRVDVCSQVAAAGGLEIRHPPPASMDELALVHDPQYLAQLEKICRSGGGTLSLDTHLGPDSFEVAKGAAGAALAAARFAGDAGEPAFALTRPPGHHSGSDYGMGFCLINSAAVAAAAAIGAGAERVMIVDYDVHHGNGTQDIFWSDPRVLYLSLHQWPWYPWNSGSVQEIGSGAGEGATVNVPLPAMTGDDVYIEAFSRIVQPVARRFRPELLIASAGFDAHARDPLSLQEMTAHGFGWIAALLHEASREVCEGRLALLLEGGYDLDALRDSFQSTVAVLHEGAALGDASSLTEGFPYSETGLRRVIEFHALRWDLE